MPGKELGVHLNGDEGMCFGSAFLGSNSTASFKVGKVLLTQNPKYDVKMLLKPLRADAAITTEEEQKAEGKEEADIVKYTEQLRMFNTTDYFGKSKAISVNYDQDMKVELWKIPAGADLDSSEAELLEEFELDDLKASLATELEDKQKQREKEKEKKKKAKAKAAAKKANATEGEEPKVEEKVEEEPEEEEQAPIERPKVRFAVEWSRSGTLRMTKASVGGTYLNVKQIRRHYQLSEDAIKQAK